jgi:penicillin-binding protein 2
MLVVDELKKNDPQLRLVAILLLAGLLLLLAGLWWVQVVSAREFQSHLETQAYRTIRIPAIRGKILDREGRVLADNRPRYNLSIDMDDLNPAFNSAYTNLLAAARRVVKHNIALAEQKKGGKLSRTELKEFQLHAEYIQQLRTEARIEAGNQLYAQLSERMGEPLQFNADDFNKHYLKKRALPYPALKDLSEVSVARFEESYTNGLAADLDLQSVRHYPNGTLAAHLLGYLQHDDRSAEGEDSSFNYRLPDYRGVNGVEEFYNDTLQGRAGTESVLVNNLGFRQSESVDTQPAPGTNVVLTIDLDIQRAAEEAIRTNRSADATAAAVVMDVRTGDILAMVSSPTFDPNAFAQGLTSDQWAQIQSSTAEKNRATFENYAPGSIFKTVVALAALENGLNPDEIFRVEPDPERPDKGAYYLGRRKIKDTAPPGLYNFRKAFMHSSNSYFVNYGLHVAGVENIVRIGEEFHLGERAGFFPGQETTGNFPSKDRINSGWHDGDTANLCIGQGEIAVTPLQMAVLTSAIANNGYVLWPRIVMRIESQSTTDSGEITVNDYTAGRVRNRLDVHPRSMQILREAMLADVKDPEGTGRAAAVPGFQICGKTGTAQVQDSANRLIGYNFWFASFAPYENPEYAVVVMVQFHGAGSGGTTCAPIAHDIYAAIAKKLSIPAHNNMVMN